MIINVVAVAMVIVLVIEFVNKEFDGTIITIYIMMSTTNTTCDTPFRTPTMVSFLSVLLLLSVSSMS